MILNFTKTLLNLECVEVGLYMDCKYVGRIIIGELYGNEIVWGWNGVVVQLCGDGIY